MTEHRIQIDHDKCIGCGMCVKDCVAHNIELKNDKAGVFSNNCIMCGHCVAICPKNAVSISGYPDEPFANTEKTRLNPGDVLNVIRFRRTIRQFHDREIPKEVLEQILEAGRLTHTAKNMQDVSFVVLDREKSKIEQLAVRLFRKMKPLANLFSPLAKRNEIGDHFFFFRAPLVIVILAKNSVDGILAAQNMEFVAEANGLGVMLSGYFTAAANASRKTKKAATTMVLGYPKVNYQRSAQREGPDVTYL